MNLMNRVTGRSLSQRSKRKSRPQLESLEDRMLLYGTYGGNPPDQWVFPNHITVSFIPDGTNIGGASSSLFSTMGTDTGVSTATWEAEIEKGVMLWANAANINVSFVADGGQIAGISGDQQGDSRFGDIRIGATSLPAGTLAQTFLPPQSGGSTDAGDILFNDTIDWQINASFDLMTIAAHESGHAFGLDESSVSTAVMYGYYNGIKQSLTADDIAGIQSIYGAHNFSSSYLAYSVSDNITGLISSNEITVSGPSFGIAPGIDSDQWFQVTVPATTTGTMKVNVQTSNLSTLAPAVLIYNSSLTQIDSASASGVLNGATVSTSDAVSSGQTYYIKVQGAGGYGAAGAYALQVNFGSGTMSPVASPNTTVPGMPDSEAYVDGDFEEPSVGTGSSGDYSLDPAGTAWAYSGTAGVAGNGSAYTAGNSNAPSGTQVGVVQGTGSMTQTIYVPVGTYDVDFYAAYRGNTGSYNSFEVLVDGTPISSFVPSTTSYQAFISSNFTLTAGAHTIKFLGLNYLGGDNTAFIDAVVLNGANSLSLSEFQSPNEGTSYAYGPTGTAWIYGGDAGVAGNSSAFTSSNPPAPAGIQVGFIQQSGSIGQTGTFIAGDYTFSALVAQRAGNSHPQELALVVDSTVEGYFTPGGTGYTSWINTSTVGLTAGSHTIYIEGVNPGGGDNTALISDVVFTPYNIVGGLGGSPLDYLHIAKTGPYSLEAVQHQDEAKADHKVKKSVKVQHAVAHPVGPRHLVAQPKIKPRSWGKHSLDN